MNRLHADGIVDYKDGRVRLTTSGILGLKRELGLLSESGKTPDNETPDDQSVPAARNNQIRVNVHESPLMRLYSRKLQSGKSYISDTEFRAGERLRSDFERGQLQPKITASYASVGSSGASGHRNGTIEISDFAMDARSRVNNALEVLGPELSGVALDICCFLKGFELTERERKWPPRSAKLMLKTALSILAKHYGFEIRNRSGHDQINGWGIDGYRPSIS
ncbi:MAG: DUF6456 domain-containing protein [Pseudomonadota bacterium]